MEIREYKKSDKEQVEEIFDLYWNDNFRESLQKKIDLYHSNNQDFLSQKFKMFVCEDNKNILGVAAYRKAPKHMLKYTSTPNPAEFYVIAVKVKGKGVGSKLRKHRIEEARKERYTELIFFSGETHKESWSFHDNSDFERVVETSAPNGEKGIIWRMDLI